MKTKKLVFTGIFIALVFVTTWWAKFPISAGWGYIHFGDLSVMLAGMLLGPVAGAVAAAFGSALADYAGGYVHYMLGTFLVKGVLAFAVGLAYKKFNGEQRKMQEQLRVIYHVVVAVLAVVGGYFLVDLILANMAIVDLEGGTVMAYATFGLIPNLIQVAFGIGASILFYIPLKKPFEEIYQS